MAATAGAPREGAGEVGVAHAPAVGGLQPGGQLTGVGAYALLGRSVEQEQGGASGGTLRPGGPAVFGEDDMGVRTAEAEGRDARGGRARVPGPGFGRADHPQAERVEVGVRARTGEVQVGGDLAVVQGEHGLDQARDTGGGFQVAEVRLGGADQEGWSRGRSRPSTAPRALASMGSPRAVPVPCAST